MRLVEMRISSKIKLKKNVKLKKAADAFSFYSPYILATPGFSFRCF
jgi:hypothetical protein